MSEKGPGLLIYFLVFIGLLLLTGLTVWVSNWSLGEWHLIVALAIAVVKAVLVVLFFMHLAYSKRLTAVMFAAALLWLAIMFALTFSDYLTRSWEKDREPPVVTTPEITKMER